MDQKGTHCKKMKNAIWLYLYLLLNADRKTGFLKRKTRTMSLDTGIKERTIRRWLGILRNQGYIEIKNNSHSLSIQIKKWKGFDNWQNIADQTGQSWPTRVAKLGQPEEGSKVRNPLYLSQKIDRALSPNDISIKKIYINDNIDDNKSFKSNFSFKGFIPKTKEELLAFDLAEALGDEKGIALYLSYAKRYPEALLRQVLGEVKEIPLNKIKKSRGALFNYLVQRHLQGGSEIQ